MDGAFRVSSSGGVTVAITKFPFVQIVQVAGDRTELGVHRVNRVRIRIVHEPAHLVDHAPQRAPDSGCTVVRILPLGLLHTPGIG